MKIIAVVGSKGGPGKTTIAELLAIEAAKQGPTLLMDLDPQQSFAGFWRERGGPENPLLISGIESVGLAVKRLQDLGRDADWLIVDTPGSLVAVIRNAINAADVVVLPLQPTHKDVQGHGAVHDLVTEAKAWDHALYVINRTDSRSTAAQETIDKLNPKGAAEPFQLPHRTAYGRTQGGKVGSEINAQCAKDAKKLWALIEGIANNE